MKVKWGLHKAERERCRERNEKHTQHQHPKAELFLIIRPTFLLNAEAELKKKLQTI